MAYEGKSLQSRMGYDGVRTLYCTPYSIPFMIEASHGGLYSMSKSRLYIYKNPCLEKETLLVFKKGSKKKLKRKALLRSPSNPLSRPPIQILIDTLSLGTETWYGFT